MCRSLPPSKCGQSYKCYKLKAKGIIYAKERGFEHASEASGDNISLVNAGTIQEGNTFYCMSNIDDVDLLLNLNKRPDVY